MNLVEVIRVLRHTKLPAVTLTTGKVGCRTEPLLNVLGNKFWIFLCKNYARVSTNILIKSNPTHGGG